MPHTSTRNPNGPPGGLAVAPDGASAAAVDRARKRIRDGYYDRPEVRRTLAALILRRAARGGLPEAPSRAKSP